MILEFRKVRNININLEYMADSFAANIDRINSFKEFLLEYLSHTITNPDGYDNWNSIRTSAYESLFVYYAERGYDSNILQKLLQIKYK